jgi:hypothetical protein
MMAILDGELTDVLYASLTLLSGTNQLRICLQVGKKGGTISVGAAIAKGV